MKRGVSAPFVWIFALVAGALVMIFLVSFAFRHVDIQETKFSYQDLNNFEINLDLISQSESLKTKIQLPEIEFPCFENTQFIKVGTASKTTGKIIFSRPVKGSTTIKTQRFNYPFPITNIYYLFTGKDYYDYNITKNNLIPEHSIFYQDLVQAECIQERLIQKIQQISRIYIVKATILRRENIECKNFYDEIIKQIKQHITEPTQQTTNKIKELNEELSLNACPELW